MADETLTMIAPVQWKTTDGAWSITKHYDDNYTVAGPKTAVDVPGFAEACAFIARHDPRFGGILLSPEELERARGGTARAWEEALRRFGSTPVHGRYPSAHADAIWPPTAKSRTAIAQSIGISDYLLDEVMVRAGVPRKRCPGGVVGYDTDAVDRVIPPGMKEAGLVGKSKGFLSRTVIRQCRAWGVPSIALSRKVILVDSAQYEASFAMHEGDVLSEPQACDLFGVHKVLLRKRISLEGVVPIRRNGQIYYDKSTLQRVFAVKGESNAQTEEAC